MRSRVVGASSSSRIVPGLPTSVRTFTRKGDDVTPGVYAERLRAGPGHGDAAGDGSPPRGGHARPAEAISSPSGRGAAVP